MGDHPVHNYPRPTVAVDTALLTWNPDQACSSWRWLATTLARGRCPAPSCAKARRWLRRSSALFGTSLVCTACAPGSCTCSMIRTATTGTGCSPSPCRRRATDQLADLGSGSAQHTRLAPVDRPGELAWDHPEIIRLAKTDIRARYETDPDPERLLGHRFTLRDLRQVHEAVAGKKLQRDKFRRTMEPRLVGTGTLEQNTGTRGRPAELFRRKR